MTPWTEIAPTGSSIFSVRSTKKTLPQSRMPAISPMITAETELTKAQGAVMATSPASKPLAIIEMSGLPYLHHM